MITLTSDAIIALLPMVRAIAHGICLPGHPVLSQEDLVQEGLLAVLAAQRTYNPMLGVSFKHYVRHRVRGAMLSALRDVAPLSRHVQSSSTPERAETIFAGFRRGAIAEPPAAPDVMALHRLIVAYAGLPAREQQVLSWIYGEEITKRAIGEWLHCHESRVYQLHLQALATLRAAFPLE